LGARLGATLQEDFAVAPMALTIVQIRNQKPEAKLRRLYDERGLYLEVTPKGNKWWRFKYRFQGKEKGSPPTTGALTS
tara:strand:- start:10 stop:243 length:234 start_codon:yes stop_codon:yes gene_type:complete